MPDRVSIVTGATGLLGSHIVDALRARGEPVRGLVRPSSDVSFLRQVGAEVVVAEIGDPASLRAALAGAGVVYHTAAQVGDWGPKRLFRESVAAAGHVLEACRESGVDRLVHVSSVSVYGHPPADQSVIDEDSPLGQRLSRFGATYARSKIAAEAAVRAGGNLVTIVRPSWILGPRDRNTLPRVLAATAGGWVSLVGDGNNLLNLVSAADVAEGAILAGTTPAAAGRAYNFASEGEITQREFFSLLAAACGRKPVRRRYPFWVAHLGGLFGEVAGSVLGMTRSPYVTRYSVGLLSRSTRYSSDRARTELGWAPVVGAHEGLRRALEWWAAR